jgi:hypothetical protein
MANSNPAPPWLDIPDPIATPVAMGGTPPPAPAPPTERSPTRVERRRRGQAALLFGAAWIAAVVAVLGLRPDLASARVAAPIVGWLVAGAVLLRVVLRPGARGLPAGVRAIQHAGWIVPAANALGALIVAEPAEGPLTWASIRGCLCLSTLIALGPLGAAALFLRGSFLSAAGWRGAAVGGLAGLAGSLGIHAHCPVQGVGHLLAAHGAAIAIGAAAGAALGRAGGRA